MRNPPLHPVRVCKGGGDLGSPPHIKLAINEFGCKITTFFLYCKKYYKENQHYATFFHKSIKKTAPFHNGTAHKLKQPIKELDCPYYSRCSVLTAPPILISCDRLTWGHVNYYDYLKKSNSRYLGRVQSSSETVSSSLSI